MENESQIKNLLEYNENYERKTQFNNIKIMVLRYEPKETIEEYILKHFKKYQDEDEKQLLLTFLNKRNVNTKN
jgi:hypothetical protein